MEMRQASTVTSGLTGATRKEKEDQAVQNRWPFPRDSEGQWALGGSGCCARGLKSLTGQTNFGGGRCHLQVCSLWSQSGKHQEGYYVDLLPEAPGFYKSRVLPRVNFCAQGFSAHLRFLGY